MKHQYIFSILKNKVRIHGLGKLYYQKTKRHKRSMEWFNQHCVNDISLVANVFVLIQANIIVPYTTVFRFLSTYYINLLHSHLFSIFFFTFLSIFTCNQLIKL